MNLHSQRVPESIGESMVYGARVLRLDKMGGGIFPKSWGGGGVNAALAVLMAASVSRAVDKLNGRRRLLDLYVTVIPKIMHNNKKLCRIRVRHNFLFLWPEIAKLCRRPSPM